MQREPELLIFAGSLVALVVDLLQKVEDFVELFVLALLELLAFFFVVDTNTAFEEANDFFVGDLARLIEHIIGEETEPGLFEASALATFDGHRVERHSREQLFVVLELVSIELSVVLVCALHHSLFLALVQQLLLKLFSILSLVFGSRGQS